MKKQYMCTIRQNSQHVELCGRLLYRVVRFEPHNFFRKAICPNESN